MVKATVHGGASVSVVSEQPRSSKVRQGLVGQPGRVNEVEEAVI